MATLPLPDDLPPPPETAALVDGAGPDDQPVAEGPGWRVDLGDVRDAAALLPEADRRRLADDPAVRAAALADAVRRAVTRSRAQAVGISLTDADRAALVRSWVDQGEQWALQLGFAPGLGRDAVKQAALVALSDSGQNASLARNALRESWGGLLRRWRPVRLGETSASVGA